MKNYFLFFIICMISFIRLTPLWSQETSFENITANPDQEELETLDDSSSQEPSSSPAPNPPHFIYQTTSLLPSSSSSPSREYSSPQPSVQNALPPTKYPFERKLLKGFSAYCGIVAAFRTGLSSGVLAWDSGLSVPLIGATAVGTGIIVGLGFTYCAWKFLNYYFES